MIYCLELIEHIHRLQAEKMLDLFHCSLKKGGKVFLTTPNYRSLWPVIEWLLDHSGLVPVMGGHQHVEFYHRKKLADLCRKHGFIVNKLVTICFLSPWLALISGRLAELMFYRECSFPIYQGLILLVVLEKK
jgi:2-polyprenyl-3-methyl-5-hydroxy-6-metoxy-1,4-benzoquinol methylase